MFRSFETSQLLNKKFNHCFKLNQAILQLFNQSNSTIKVK